MITSRIYLWLLCALMFVIIAPLCGRDCGVLAQPAKKDQPPTSETAREQAGETMTAEDAEEITRLLDEAIELHLHGRSHKAIVKERRVLEIYERIFGPTSPDVAAVLNIIGETARQNGDLALADQMFQRALAIYKKSHGEQSREAAKILKGLGSVWMAQGDFSRAGPTVRQALSTFEKLLGDTHPDSTATLLILAELYRHQGDYDRAEESYREALARTEKAQGGDDRNAGGSLSGLATLYQERGDLVRAEQVFRRALQVMSKALGKEAPDVARMVVNFAELYAMKGDYSTAEAMYGSALRTFEKRFGPDHPYVALTLTDQASLYEEMGDLLMAEKLLRRAEVINRKSLGNEHPNVADVMDQLGGLYTKQGDFARAEPTLRRALEMNRKYFGENHLITALSYNQLAVMYGRKGDLYQAQQLYQRALAIMEKLFETNNFNIASILSNLAMVSLQQGDVARAIDLQKRGDDIREYHLRLILGTGSERQKFLYIISSLGSVFRSISLHTKFAPNTPTAARLAFEAILRFKARSLDAMTDHLGILRRRAGPQERELLNKFLAVRTQLAALSLGEIGKSDQGEYLEKLSALRVESERLERQISALSETFRTQFQPLTMERVQKEIPANAALVELIAYEPLRFKKAGTTEPQFGETRYAAYVLRNTGEPTFADLGEVATINRAAAKLREALADPQSKNNRQAARALDEMVMRPVRKLIGNERMLLISTDGALNLVPFNALVDEHNKYLIENYTIVYLTSGRDLLRPRARSGSWQPPLVIADPLFDAEPRSASGGSSADGRRSVDFTQFTYGPLPGTAAEAYAIGELLHVRPLMQEQATEKALKQVTSPRILHVATHGFFLLDDDRDGAAGSVGGNSTLTVAPRAAWRENPLLRSGLVLAGVMNRRSGEGEDGVLTALETAGLDLWGTQLVVLSACNTGVGEIQNGDGVAGLRRALVLAGSQSQVISLWKISDTATKDLMVSYYKRLLADEGRGEALRQVQMEMLQGKLLPLPSTTLDKQKGKRETGEMVGEVKTRDYRHPYYWAAFIPSGDWRSLDGK